MLEDVSVMNNAMGDAAYSFVKNTLLDNFLKLAKVNVLTGEYEFLKYDAAMKEDSFENIPNIYKYIEKQVADNLILSEYAVDYLNYSNPEYVKKRIFIDGDKRIVQSYKCKSQTGYIWITFGIVISSEASLENPWVLFYWQNADTNTTTMADALSTLSTIYYKILKVNLTNDTFQIIKTSQEEWSIFASHLEKISEWWRQFGERGYVYDDDIDAYNKFTDINRLRQFFHENSNGAQSGRYRRRIDDSWRWVQLDLIPSIEYTDDSQILILYVRDIHDEYLKEKRNREALLDKYHRDALTRLYNRHKYNEDIEEMSKSGIPHLTACYIDVNGLHELNNKLGHEKGDDMLCTIADTLKKYFPDDMVYRIGGDEFIVLSRRLSKSSVENIISRVREDLIKDNYEIAAGVESGQQELPIHKIIGAAELAMRTDKENYYKNNGNQRKRRELNAELEETLTEKKYAERFLDIISDKYNGVYFVNLKQDTLRHIYIPYYFLELIEATDYCYSRAMQLYIQKYVKLEYYDAFNEMLDYKLLVKKLKREKVVSFSYQKVDGSRMYLRIINQGGPSESIEETIWIFSGEQMK